MLGNQSAISGKAIINAIAIVMSPRKGKPARTMSPMVVPGGATPFHSLSLLYISANAVWNPS